MVRYTDRAQIIPPLKKLARNGVWRYGPREELFDLRWGLDLTEPLSGFCAGFSLAEGQVVVTSRRQLGPIFRPVMFSNSRGDGNPAGLVNKAVRHGCLRISNLYTSIRWRFASICDGDHKIADSRRFRCGFSVAIPQPMILILRGCPCPFSSGPMRLSSQLAAMSAFGPKRTSLVAPHIYVACRRP